MRVGFEHCRRDATPCGGEHHRAADVAAATEHDVGTPRGQDSRTRRGCASREQERARERRRGPSRQAGDREGVELVPRLRDESSLDAVRRPGKGHVDAALLERLSDR